MKNIQNPNSELALAFLYKNGDGVEQDREKAKEMTREEAENLYNRLGHLKQKFVIEV